jgi:hypothetical protein
MKIKIYPKDKNQIILLETMIKNKTFYQGYVLLRNYTDKTITLFGSIFRCDSMSIDREKYSIDFGYIIKEGKNYYISVEVSKRDKFIKTQYVERRANGRTL